MKPNPDIGVVVVHRGDPAASAAAHASVGSGGRKSGETWAVLGLEDEGDRPALEAAFGKDRVLVHPETAPGLAALCDLGIAEALRAGSDYVLLLDGACRLDEGALSPLLIALEAQKQAGVACPALLDAGGGVVLACGGRVGRWTARIRPRLRGTEATDPDARHWVVVDFAPAPCVLLKREFIEDVGLYHGAYGSFGFEAELGHRARKEHWKTLALPHSRARWAPPPADPAGVIQEAFERARNPLWLQRAWGVPVKRLLILPSSIAWHWPLAFASHLFTGRFRAAGAVVRGSLHGLFGRGLAEGRHLAVPIQGRKIALTIPTLSRSMMMYLL